MIASKFVTPFVLSRHLGLDAAASDLRVGRRLREKNRFDAADEVLRRGLSKAPSDPRLLVEYALSAHDSGRFGLALERWEQARMVAPNLPITWLGSVTNACRLGHHNWAERVIGEASRRFPGDEAVTNEAERLADHSKLLCCINCTSQRVEGWVAQRNATGHIILLILVNGVEQGRVAPSLDRFDVQQEIGFPGYGFLFELPVQLRDGDVVSIRERGGNPVRGFAGAADSDGACSIVYSNAPSFTSTSPLNNRISAVKKILAGAGALGLTTAAMDLRIGKKLKQKKRFDDADAAFRRGLRKAPLDPRLLVEYALSANDSGRYRIALERWEEARAAAPNVALVWLGSVVNACHLGMWEWAGPVIAEAARRFPDDESIASEAKRHAHRTRIFACIDSCTSHQVAGWAAQEATARQIVLMILVNGRVKGRVAPWLDRPGLREAVGMTGYGFFFEFPVRLRDGDVVTFQDRYGQPVEGWARPADDPDLTFAYSVPPLRTSTHFLRNRVSIANHFLTGDGVEIGAFMMPTDLSPDQNVVYYDRFPFEALQKFDKMPELPIMKPSFVGDADTLDGLADASFNFLIANHVIEHLRDPIRFLENVARVLNSGGRAFLSVPDRRYSFDFRRPLTSFEHLARDYERGPEVSEREHLFEYSTLVDGRTPTATLQWMEERDKNQMPIHYHVWEMDSFVEFVRAARERFEIPLQVIYADDRAKEINVVLEKQVH